MTDQPRRSLALEDFRADMEGCSRCSSCKWIPLDHIKGRSHSQVCPSISHYEYHAYSGSGKLNTALSIIDGRSEFDESAADIFYSCTMCGGCDVGCKVYRNDIDSVDTFIEARARAVELGLAPIEAQMMVESMRAENNTLGTPKERRADWAEGLGLLDANREQVEILLHVGCRYSFDPELREGIRNAAMTLQKTGRRVGIFGKAESCNGFRAYEAGFKSEFENFSDDMVSRVRSCGAQLVVVACADCFGAFTYAYPKNGKDLGVPVRHITSVMEEMRRDGRLTLAAVPPRKVTYHDPCNLGRKGQPYCGTWEANKLDRPDEWRRDGRVSNYDAPRDVIRSIPGVELVEMDRIREYSWCCGAGGACFEAKDDFSLATAKERIAEAVSTGADAMVTSCPWCVTNFNRALADLAAEGDAVDLEIVDICDLVAEAADASEETGR